ncbi:hypothetical protein OH76DRAFT_1358353 [Lentinus brumalis]|uniref:Uncharacterized protein n=1 Tax=Lentinus brumalis TaxID=2498619 RepID=A0A371CY50_9APHY|nr:hypothetical protein OH76DRAFT_1358353 [Polyporus brumalis]
MLVLEWLDIHALLRVRATCADGDQAASATLSRRIRLLMLPYFTDYAGFIEEMRLSSAVVTGEAALHVLHPHHGPPPTLALALPDDLFFHMVGYLVRVEFYSYAMSTHHNGSQGLQRLTRTATLRKETCTIEIIQSGTHSPLTPTLSGWNTALTAYFTPNGFCDPYALLSRQQRALLNPWMDQTQQNPLWIRQQKKSWRNQGWKILAGSVVEGARDGCAGRAKFDCAGAVRVYGDADCVAGPWQPVRNRREERKVPLDLVQRHTVMWWRGGRTCGERCQGGLMRLTPGGRTVLRELAKVM